MKTISRFTFFLLFFISIITFIACDKTVPIEPARQLPVLTTNEITLISQNTATSGGSITSDGGFEVSARGVCWSLKPNPTIIDSLTKDAGGSGKFTSSLKYLIADTTYYVRAYATNKDGTAYGLQITFKTLETILPVLSTTAATNITGTNAISGGNITFNGGSPITALGVCWSTTENPTIANNKTTDGNGGGIFTSNMTNLLTGTTYYLKAYATNSAGTAYGSEITFKTLSVPTITTTIVTAITATTANSGGNVTSDGGATLTARGVCWSTTSNPTISNYITTNGSSIGSFTSNLSGLTVGITYYIRAYASNSIGTAYGNQLSFVLTPTVNDIDGNEYHYVKIGNQTWMVENLKTTKYNDGTAIPLVTNDTAWNNLTTPGYCWFKNDAATNKSIYGAMYNWYAVNTSKLAPAGWHVATIAEWTTLKIYVSSNQVTSSSVAGALAATTNWTSCTTKGTLGNNLTTNNSFGFTALPGGCRGGVGFGYIGMGGFWWSTTEERPLAWCSTLYYDYSSMYEVYRPKSYGFSVRCVRD